MMNGSVNPLPNSSDLTPPHCAAARGELYIVYIPRGNNSSTIGLINLDDQNYAAKWVNPRNGSSVSINGAPSSVSQWVIPDRPEPSNEDWVLVLEKDVSWQQVKGEGGVNEV